MVVFIGWMLAQTAMTMILGTEIEEPELKFSRDSETSPIVPGSDYGYAHMPPFFQFFSYTF